MAWCFDKRVLIGLAVVAVVGFAVAPEHALAALPVLIALACPLSMLVMMRQRHPTDGDIRAAAPGADDW